MSDQWLVILIQIGIMVALVRLCVWHVNKMENHQKEMRKLIDQSTKETL